MRLISLGTGLSFMTCAKLMQIHQSLSKLRIRLVVLLEALKLDSILLKLSVLCVLSLTLIGLFQEKTMLLAKILSIEFGCLVEETLWEIRKTS